MYDSRHGSDKEERSLSANTSLKITNTFSYLPAKPDPICLVSRYGSCMREEYIGDGT